MDAGMDMEFPGNKAGRHCDRVEIHCGTHPVGMTDADNLSDNHFQFKPTSIVSRKLRTRLFEKKKPGVGTEAGHRARSRAYWLSPCGETAGRHQRRMLSRPKRRAR
ncbi:hypothetical protein EXN67_17050 [Rhizobium rhizogenes]|nr:hypothetical protein FFE80_14150 [Rhizobium rhizogenes]TRB10354.1 hypothetical protein EXN67_17050 [Rhizobium rhizogenes]TRB20901.1 hypothetical protein EXN70_22075 [Rhizobium rhizogenes]TRB41375.1 hypothetical protein EXN73_19300 [Rhizobium rhizogenes]TRB52129.1 hypothetical protein EXN69_25870 [Rhizobium rhizogenes]